MQRSGSTNSDFVRKLYERSMIVAEDDRAEIPSVDFDLVEPLLKNEGWEIIVIKPGQDPFGAITSALFPAFDPKRFQSRVGYSWVDDLRMPTPIEVGRWHAAHKSMMMESPTVLTDILLLMRLKELPFKGGGPRIVLWVVRIDELYSSGIEQEELDLFTKCLAAVAKHASYRIRVVLTVRSDIPRAILENKELNEAVTIFNAVETTLLEHRTV